MKNWLKYTLFTLLGIVIGGSLVYLVSPKLMKDNNVEKEEITEEKEETNETKCETIEKIVTTSSEVNIIEFDLIQEDEESDDKTIEYIINNQKMYSGNAGLGKTIVVTTPEFYLIKDLEVTQGGWLFTIYSKNGKKLDEIVLALDNNGEIDLTKKVKYDNNKLYLYGVNEDAGSLEEAITANYEITLENGKLTKKKI